MATSLETKALFARLAAHHPTLGGRDTFADIRAADWCEAIETQRPDVATQAIGDLVAYWPTAADAPKIGDFLEACRGILRQQAIPTVAQLEPPTVEPVDPGRLHALLTRARRALTGVA